MKKTPTETLRAKWLAALLPNVAFDGWTEAAAEAAAAEAGLTDGEQALAAPNGISDLVDAFFAGAEHRAAEKLADMDMSAMRVPDKVAAGVKAWLDELAPYHEAVRRAIARGLLPWGAGGALQRKWSVADMVWDAAGDTATDYNRYTKRGLLVAVMLPIMLKWVDRPSDKEMVDFINRRLRQVSKLGQAGGRVAKPALDMLSRLAKYAPRA